MKNENQKKRPSHAIYVVYGEKEKARWVKIGAAFPNRDNKGLSLLFDAYPAAGGRTVLREIGDQPEATADNGGQQ